MSDTQEKYMLYSTLLFVVGLMFLLLIFDWIAFVNLQFGGKYFVFIIMRIKTKVHSFLIFFRMIYILSLFLLFYLKPNFYRGKHKKKSYHYFLAMFFIGVFVIGYINLNFYNLYIYPLLLFFVVWSVSVFEVVGNNFSDENIFGISHEETAATLFYLFPVANKRRVLKVHSAEQHMYVEGGSGAGKSATFIKPTIVQQIQKDLPALIYDVKGELKNTAYSAFYEEKKKGRKMETQFKIIDFSDITRSYRINPFNEKYIKELKDARKLMSVFLKNNVSEWVEKGSIWYTTSLSLWSAMIMRLYGDPKLRQYLSFPLLFELFSSSKTEELLEFINENPVAKQEMVSVNLASAGSIKQFTGTYTSANSFLGDFTNNKDLYWLLSASEIDLDVNNPKNPTFLCVTAGVKDSVILSAIIATIITLVSDYFLLENQKPTLFQLDEIYTIYLDDLPKKANVFRSTHVSMQIGNQLYEMLLDRYGTNKAAAVMGACGNQFYGMGNNATSSKRFVELLSDVDKHDVRYSTSDSNVTVSDSSIRRKALQIRDIVDQPPGAFTGKIAGGKPVFFREQFEYIKTPKHTMPAFVLTEQTKEDLDEKVTLNYQRIAKLADDILSQYTKEEEDVENN